MVILVVSVCNQELHNLEFVEPLKEIIIGEKQEVLVVNYKELSFDMLNKSEKVVICGTSLKDNSFLGNLLYFDWIKDLNKPLLGICAGMQIIGLIFGEKIKSKTEIGLFEENFSEGFLGLSGNNSIWHLHNNFVDFGTNWEVFCSGNKIPQAVKHKNKDIFCCLFHPEVRNKKVIEEFLEL